VKTNPFSLSLLLLMIIFAGCGILEGQVLEDRPAAPDFVLKTSQGERCALSDFRGKLVALYMTNL